ncbi:MAG: DUF2007 domain-containing protein, partial [Candidatus Eisenbacteria bacterium]
EVAKMQNDSEALVVRGLLEANGIEVVFRATLVQSVHPITINGVGEVRILVRPEDAEKARELLSGRQGMDLPAE